MKNKSVIEHFADATRLHDKIERMRKASRFIHGDEYEVKIQFYKDRLLNFQKAHKIEDLTKALITLISLIATKEHSEYTTIHLTAAYAELAELSTT